MSDEQGSVGVLKAPPLHEQEPYRTLIEDRRLIAHPPFEVAVHMEDLGYGALMLRDISQKALEELAKRQDAASDSARVSALTMCQYAVRWIANEPGKDLPKVGAEKDWYAFFCTVPGRVSARIDRGVRLLLSGIDLGKLPAPSASAPDGDS